MHAVAKHSHIKEYLHQKKKVNVTLGQLFQQVSGDVLSGEKKTYTTEHPFPEVYTFA